MAITEYIQGLDVLSIIYLSFYNNASTTTI